MFLFFNHSFPFLFGLDAHFFGESGFGKKSSCGSGYWFFHISDDSEQLFKNLKEKFSAPNCLKRMINTKKTYVAIFP